MSCRLFFIERLYEFEGDVLTGFNQLWLYRFTSNVSGSYDYSVGLKGVVQSLRVIYTRTTYSSVLLLTRTDF